MLNPFLFGDPVPPEAFVDRQREVRRVVGRILHHGQSSAIVGYPRAGKTSLLRYLMAPQNRQALYSEAAERLHFCYLDSMTLGEGFSPAQFWRYALQPIAALASEGDSPLAAAYHTAEAEGFGHFVLERLLARLDAAGHRLVLLLDEFDLLLEHPAFHRTEFFGGLRSLATRTDGLTLVLASRQSLSALNRRTQELSRTGSPFFNFLDEIPLPPFSQRASNKVLAMAGKRFTPNDRAFILDLAGGHPYFLQALAFELWEAYEEEMDEAVRRRRQAAAAFYNKARDTLHDIWRLWPAEMKKAFVTVALDEAPRLLGMQDFDLSHFIAELPMRAPELHDLHQRGFITEDAQAESGWRVTAGVLLQFVADELVQALRTEDDLRTWLTRQQWDGLLKRGEKEQLLRAARWLKQQAQSGIQVFLNAFAEGLGRGMSSLPR